jgi:putative transposase
MARQLRIEFAGAFYHVMARGDRREPIVEDDSDRLDFLETLARVCRKTGWRVHAWVLMSNHYQAVILDPEDSGGYYFESLLDYIHLNPVGAGMARTGAGRGIVEHPWSSLPSAYAVAPSKRMDWMETAAGFAVAGCRHTAAGRGKYVEALEDRWAMEQAEGGRALPERQSLQSTLRRGWYWGSEAFKEKLLDLLGESGPRRGEPGLSGERTGARPRACSG